MTAADPLADRCIGIPESRQLDLFADMLQDRGARIWRCPLVDIRPTPDSAPVQAWIDDIAAHGLDDMIWLTGEGVRRVSDFLEERDTPTQTAFWQHMAQARTVTRGPKPGRELRPRGISVTLPATEPTTTGVIDALSGIDLSGHRVGVQLYGTDPNIPLMNALVDAGALALPVSPYVYADDAEDSEVAAFIAQMIDNQLDAVAFTSSPQVKRLFKVAARLERQDALVAAMQQLCVASVGPLVSDTLASYGVSVDLMPETHYFMKPLVRALSAHFGHAPAA